MAKSPFANMDKVELGFSREPFLSPADVVRDLTQPENKQIVSSRPATYDLLIESVELFEPRKGADILKVIGRVLTALDGGPSIGLCCYMLATDSEYFQRDAARFLCNLMNAPPTALAASDYDRLVSAEQPARGRVIRVRVSSVKTKANSDFTAHEWSPVLPVGNEQGQIVGAVPVPFDNVAAFLAAQRFTAAA